MAQIKTYGSGRQTEAQKIAAEERRRENEQTEEMERRKTLDAVAGAEIQKVAADIVLEKEKNIVPPDPAILLAHEEEKQKSRELDHARLDKLVADHKRGKKTFYTGMKMALGAAQKDMARYQDAARVAARLGVTNPITSGVMGVGESSGMIQNNVRFVEAVCKRFAKRYRAIGYISAEDFESPVGT